MQETNRASAGTKSPASPTPFLPFLDLAVIGVEAQLKAWQAYQVEGARFIARRMHANLEFLRALSHSGDTPSSMGDCCQAWFENARKDYAEECGRLAGTASALGFADMAAFGQLLGRPTPQSAPSDEPAPRPQISSKFQAAA